MTIQSKAESDAQAFMQDLAIDPFDLPINPFTVASAVGIDVWLSDLDDNTAGMIERRTGQRPQIYLNVNDHIRRQRFTCGHELGHFVGHETGRFSGLSYLDKRDDIAGQGREPKEIYANSFAAEMLMPRKAVVHFYNRDFPPAQLARLFNVSQAAMVNRLLNLGLEA